jgi:aspartate/glutamate racemase
MYDLEGVELLGFRDLIARRRSSCVGPARAYAHAALRLTAGVAQYIVSALNTMHQLRQHGQDNVLLLTASQADCRFATSQEVVRVRVCAWSEQLASPR